MKIGNSPKADSGYKIDFSRIDNPVEALLVPPVDAAAITNVDKAQGTIKSRGDSFEFDYRTKGALSNPKLEFKREGRKSQLKISQEGFSAHLQGNFEESPVNLTLGANFGGFELSGQVGEVEIKEEISLGNPFFGGPVLTSKGEIGGLEYEEKFYLAEDNTLVSKGHLGDMEVSRKVSEEKGRRKIEGHIGDIEFQEDLKIKHTKHRIRSFAHKIASNLQSHDDHSIFDSGRNLISPYSLYAKPHSERVTYYLRWGHESGERANTERYFIRWGREKH